MMLVMIHGIAQENSTEAELLGRWRKLITDVAPTLLTNVQNEMAYYGKELARLTNENDNIAIPMGTGSTSVSSDAAEATFLLQAVEEVARRQNIDESSVSSATSLSSDAVPMGTWVGRRLVEIVGALEKISPLKGALVLQVLRQAYAYLAKPGVGAAIDNLVRSRFDGEKLVVVSHSLGTVIAFKLLREMEAAGIKVEVPLFITMGSPLALDAVKAKLGPPRKKPAFVKRWLNFYDPADFISLGRDLDANTFAANIDNVGDVNNTTDNAHGILGYLPEKRVIAALEEVL